MSTELFCNNGAPLSCTRQHINSRERKQEKKHQGVKWGLVRVDLDWIGKIAYMGPNLDPSEANPLFHWIILCIFYYFAAIYRNANWLLFNMCYYDKRLLILWACQHLYD